MKVFVASTNPVKINAVTIAVSETFPDAEVKGLSVESGVPEQPMTDLETWQGSINRAHNLKKLVFEKATELNFDPENDDYLFVGAEGGVDQPPFAKDDELWSTVWMTVLDKKDREYSSNGARFKVPDIISRKLLAGEEMGPIVGELFGKNDIKKKNGAIGVITKNFIDRTEEYVAIVKLAIGLWYGRDWQEDLD